MIAWAFSCKTADEVGALIQALGKHRYVKETDLRVHWAVDAALADLLPGCMPHVEALQARQNADRDLDLSSYEPTLWRATTAAEVAAMLAVFWTPGEQATQAAANLRRVIEGVGLPLPDHAPFEGDSEYPHHPVLFQLSWTLYPIDELDAERHAGALKALEDASEEIDPGEAVEHEVMDLGVAELTGGAPNGVLTSDFLVWADGPYAYSDYVFRGASKVAKLPDPPEGLRDLDDE